MAPETPGIPRVALVGVVGYARIYLDLLLPAHDAGRLKIVAAAVIPTHQDLPETQQLRDRGAVIHSSWEALLEAHGGGLEIAFIPTGIQWHARMTVAALRAGANVLVEKPLAGSPRDAEAVRQCEKETGRWVAVGFQDIYTAENLWLKAQLLGGRIGKVKSVSMLGLWPRPRAYYARNHWAGRLVIDGAPAMDSPLNNAFAHFINLALFLAAPSLRESVDAEVRSCELLRAHNIESFDTAIVRASSANDVNFWFGVSHACHETFEPELRIRGERGTVEWRHEQSCTIIPDNGEPETVKMPGTDPGRQRMFDAILARVDDPDVLVCDTGIASKHTALIEAIHRFAGIYTVDASMIDPDGPAIIGIEDAIRAAYQSGSTLAGAGFTPKLTGIST